MDWYVVVVVFYLSDMGETVTYLSQNTKEWCANDSPGHRWPLVVPAPFSQGPQSVLYTVGVTLYTDHIIWQSSPNLLQFSIGSASMLRLLPIWALPLVPTRSHSNHYKHRPFTSCRIDLFAIIILDKVSFLCFSDADIFSLSSSRACLTVSECVFPDVRNRKQTESGLLSSHKTEPAGIDIIKPTSIFFSDHRRWWNNVRTFIQEQWRYRWLGRLGWQCLMVWPEFEDKKSVESRTKWSLWPTQSTQSAVLRPGNLIFSGVDKSVSPTLHYLYEVYQHIHSNL